MSLGDLFKPIATEPEPPRRKRLGATTDSIALIANNGGTGVVLAYDGAGIECCIDEGNGKALDDNGLDDAPDGLSIWEGAYHTWHVHTPDMNEWEAELRGTFRDLTDREWALLRETGTPWEFEP